MKLDDFCYINPTEKLERNQLYDFVEMADLIPGNRYVHAKTKEVFNGSYSKFTNKDVLMAKITPCLENGKISQYIGDNKAFGSTEFNIFRAKENISDSDFLYYLISSDYVKDIAVKSMTGACGRQRANTDEIKQIEVGNIDIKIQQKIAKILSNYDDLIENNNKRIKILEEMAQKIYKEWFVDFKYPGHETATFKDTELGRIPSDWEVKTLKDTIDSIKETIKPGEHLKNLRYVPIDCIPRKSFFLTTSESYKNAQSSLILFKKSDILFGNMRSYFHKVILAPFDGITRTTCFVLRPKVDNYRSWAFLTMFQDSTVAYSSRNSKGATIPYSFWEDGLAEMKVIFPSTKIIKAFNDIINPMLENIQQGYFKQENLKQTRDLLLPRLISGEIDVENLEIK